MRILAVTPYYEPEGGGLERYAHAILAQLAARGHDVEVLAFTRQGLSDERRDGVTVQRQAPLLRLGNSPVDPTFTARVVEAIRRFSPDVVVGHTPVPFPAEMAYRAARKERVPFVTTYHAGELRGSAPVLQGLAMVDRLTLQRAMLAGSARLIAVSPYVRDHALARERQRTTVVPPGVDTSLFRPGAASDGRTVLFVGPLSEGYRWKGVDVLLEAFRIVRAKMPEARLALVGDGDRAKEIRHKAQRMGGVTVHGRLSDEGLVACYQSAAMTVLPSITPAESFGMVLAEANACGRPVIGSDIGGIPHFVHDGDNGLLVSPHDPDDLAEKIMMLLSDPAEADAMGARGRERVEREHDWAYLAAVTENVLSAATGAAPDAARDDLAHHLNGNGNGAGNGHGAPGDGRRLRPLDTRMR